MERGGNKQYIPTVAPAFRTRTLALLNSPTLPNGSCLEEGCHEKVRSMAQMTAKNPIWAAV
jgi:hypothetical protein